jgi:hypothetical protein
MFSREFKLMRDYYIQLSDERTTTNPSRNHTQNVAVATQTRSKFDTHNDQNPVRIGTLKVVFKSAVQMA